MHADLSEYVVLALQLPCLPHPVLFTESRYPRITEARGDRSKAGSCSMGSHTASSRKRVEELERAAVPYRGPSVPRSHGVEV